MARFLMVTWDGAGNLVSTLGVARHLAEQGHDVRLLGHQSIQDRIGDHGWRFRPFTLAKDWSATTEFELETEMETLGHDLWFSPLVAREVVEELEREPADLVVADCMLIGALCAGQASGLPTVALFHTSFSLFLGGPMVEMFSPMLPIANAIRTDLGLEPIERLSDIYEGCALNLVAVPKEFEPEIPMPANVRHIGPVLDGPPLMRKVDEVAPGADPEPLIVISMSTSNQDQLPTLQRIAGAVSTLPVRALITTGPAVDPGDITAADNTQVVQFVPHDRLLPNASLVITHCGLGTVMAALTHGVPMLCMPMGRDQFFNASRVEDLGAGRSVVMDAYPAAISSTVKDLLVDEKARVGAKRMADVIANYGGAMDAVAELERLVVARV